MREKQLGAEVSTIEAPSETSAEGSESPEVLEADLDSRSHPSSHSESDETQGMPLGAGVSTIEAPSEVPQDWRPESGSPLAPIEPWSTARESPGPQAPPVKATRESPSAESGGEPAPAAPARPRRSGWWQRARASIVGD